MTPELQKMLLAIDRQEDKARLRCIARDLASSLALATVARRNENGYRVVQPDGYELAEGNRDYAIGYAEALQERCHGTYRVMCGEFEVWPEWGGSLPSGSASE